MKLEDRVAKLVQEQGSEDLTFSDEELLALLREVAAKEREACAALADRHRQANHEGVFFDSAGYNSCLRIAEAIRARVT